MKLWILQKAAATGASYEERPFREEAPSLGIALEVVSPDEIDLIVIRGGPTAGTEHPPERNVKPSLRNTP